MAKVAIVTDSTAYLPDELITGLPVFSLPLQIIWGGQSYKDNIDIKSDEFYKRLNESKELPTTSQPSPTAFKELFSNLLDQGYDILSVLISSKLSGTVDSALQAKNSLAKSNITIFDSESTSMAMGFQVLSAARAAVNGATLDECCNLVEKARSRTRVYFIVSTLEFLHRGGRIGGASAFLGTALDLKPILMLKDGKIEAIRRVRTMGKAIDHLVNLVQKEIGDSHPIHLGGLHANGYDNAQLLLERVRQKFNPSYVTETIFTGCSPVIGTHTGPGTIGISFMIDM